ncbi:unnamed protein product, partial [Scytosiphon promiscuus]
GTAALHVAAGEGHSEVLSDLLQHGAQVDAVDALGMTPLMYAINKDHGDATGLLCDYGADVRGALIRQRLRLRIVLCSAKFRRMCVSLH